VRTPDAIARVTLYSTSAGGRKGPTPSDFYGCPLLFEGESGYYDARFILEKHGPLKPGEAAEVPMTFLLRDFVPRVRPGQRFTMREVRNIGEGEIVAILAND
jgi:hypothetical protein